MKVAESERTWEALHVVDVLEYRRMHALGPLSPVDL